MKVSQVNFSGSIGGASVAAARLHRAFLGRGTDSELLCFRDARGAERVECLHGALAWKIDSAKNRVLKYLTPPSRVNNWSINLWPSDLLSRLDQAAPDVVHLHWVNAEMVSIEQLGRLRRPCVWTLHDMWAFCGAEHYTDDRRYVQGYDRRCDGGLADLLDIDRWTWRRKKRAWEGWRPQIVTPSNWLASCARESFLFRDLDVAVIPYCLDLERFRRDPMECRARLGLPLERPLALFGSSDSSPRKGMDLLVGSLERLAGAADFELCCFGGPTPPPTGFVTHDLGAVRNPDTMIDLYASADVYVHAARMDNLPNTVAESLAAGTPVVAFEVGGVPDMVVHEENGCLARAFDVEDLAQGIRWVLAHPRPAALRAAALTTAQELFDPARVTARYLEVYEAALGD